MVTLNDAKLPNTRWSLGRMDEVHSGYYNKVAIVSINTAGGRTTRSVVKLAPLPVNGLEEREE